MRTIERVMKVAFQNPIISSVGFIGERKMKEWIFDCQSCGNCILSHTAFVCPMRCPKQQRNGPCGGAEDGFCEVYPGKRRCVWDEIWESANEIHRVGDLREDYEPPPDWRLYGTSAWDNMLEGRLHGASFFDTLFKKGEPILVEMVRVTFQMMRLWFRRVFGPGWRRYDGRPPQ